MSSSKGNSVDVLIGSPRDSFWAFIQSFLKEYYPYKLRHIRTVDDLLESSSLDFKPALAIIDGQDGTTLSNEWVQSAKMNFTDCHVIVLHTASATLDFNLVKKNGADAIMHLTYDREFIFDMILQLAPVEISDENTPITALMPVDMRDIEAGMQMNFDIHVHLPANKKTILMRKSGDTIEQRHVEKFKELRQSVYIKKTQMKAFFEYARTVMTLRDTHLPISMTEKFHRSKAAIYEIMTQFLNGAVTDYTEGKEIYERCKNIITDFELTRSLSHSEIYTEICRFAGNRRTNYHDCICLSAYAAYFAQLLDWNEDNRASCALAGLLHNIGLAQMPIGAADKDFSLYSAEETLEYQRYPERSVNMVKAKKVPLPGDVSEAIGQHRELGNRSGFPKKLDLGDISSFGKLMAIAYHFHELTALYEGKAANTPAQALNKISDNAMSGSGTLDLVMVSTITKKLRF